MFSGRRIFLLLLGLVAGVVTSAAAADTQIVAGAGTSTGIVKVFFEEFSKEPAAREVSFLVMDASVKHAGGLKNSDVYLFGRSGRPLSQEEKSSGKREIFLGQVEVRVAIGMEVGLKTLTTAQLREIFTRKIRNWKEVGGPDAPIVLLGREPNESVMTRLLEVFPWMRDVTFDQVFKKDDEVAKFLASPGGRHAIVFGSESQFPSSQLLNVPDLRLGIKVGLIYDQKNEEHPLVREAKRLSNSKAWKALVVKNGFMPL